MIADPLIVAGVAAAVVLLLTGVGLTLRRRGRGSAGAGRTVPRGTPWVIGLAKTRGTLADRLLQGWRGPGTQDQWLREVEEVLLGADVGVRATRALLTRLQSKLRQVESADAVRGLLKAEMREMLIAGNDKGTATPAKPHVILVVGVNGVGKTTTIGKLAHRYRRDGKKVLLVAGDTFRAAAAEQLAKWAERVGVDIVKHQSGADPSAVVFDGMKAGMARGADVIIIDTAGRLHVKEHLMQEMRKIARTIERQMEGAPHETLLVIDATTGQNALNQARVFGEAVKITGVVLTKLDGTAKGGIAFAICADLGLPIHSVGLGEGPDDLARFDADAFLAALFDPVASEATLSLTPMAAGGSPRG
jgi:fused signal recognition particle receptor